MLWIFIAVVLWGGIHSLLASNRVKKMVIERLGERLGRYYRLGYNLFAGISFLPVLVLVVIVPDRKVYTILLPWSALMALGELLAVLGLLVGLWQTGAMEFLGFQQLVNGSADEGLVEAGNSQLVSSGLYRYVRHPLYSAGMAIIWLVPIMTMNILMLNAALTIYIVAGAYLEENKLRQKYGQQYKDYAKVTPMFIPFIKRRG
jgi:protein-S-isoprenylcysteine O-methyltransferase Ste14